MNDNGQMTAKMNVKIPPNADAHDKIDAMYNAINEVMNRSKFDMRPVALDVGDLAMHTMYLLKQLSDQIREKESGPAIATE